MTIKKKKMFESSENITIKKMFESSENITIKKNQCLKVMET